MSVNAVNSDGSLLRVAGGTLYADAPIGTISPFGGSVIPSGYLLCNGAEVLKTAYAELYAVIGDAFGTASDNTKFKLPDLREAVPVGSGTRGSGVADHDTYAVGQFKDDQLQDHDHKVKRTGLNGGTVMEGIVNWSNGDPAANTSPASINTTTRTGTTTHGKQLGVNYIIKAKQAAVPADFKDAIDDAIKSELTPSIVLRTSPISRGYAVFYLPKGVTAAKAVLLDILGYTLVTGSCNLVHYTQFSSEAWYVTTASLNTGFNTNLIDGDTIIIKIELTY